MSAPSYISLPAKPLLLGLNEKVRWGVGVGELDGGVFGGKSQVLV